MSLRFWRPWIDPQGSGEGAQAERYALRDLSNACYLSIDSSSELIGRVPDPSRAWAFHTHERAVCAARELIKVYGQPVDVVKLI